VPLLVIIALFLLRARSVAADPFHRLFAERLGDIVWIYRIDTSVSVSGVPLKQKVGSVGVGLRSGKLLQFDVGGLEQANDAIVALRSLAPGITVGFSKENQARFGSDPASLRGAA
jgi:hypothetical protein